MSKDYKLLHVKEIIALAEDLSKDLHILGRFLMEELGDDDHPIWDYYGKAKLLRDSVGEET